MRKILFYYPDMRELALEIARRSSLVYLSEIIWDRFEDGYPNIFIKYVEELRGSDVTFLASFESPRTIFEQLAVIRAIPRYGAGALRVVLPYFPGTMDRVDEEGQIATAKSLARELEAIPLCRGNGPAELVIFDIHALQERFYFNDNVVPRCVSALDLLIEKLQRQASVAVAFPDEGAAKRFGRKLAAFPQIICTKVRDGDKRVVTIKEGDSVGKHIVIVDDLVKTGGTLLECKRALYLAGASHVSAYVTHGVFPQESWKRFLDVGFRHFWMTDSCPLSAWAVRGQPPFEVLSLAPLVAGIIRL